MPGEKDKDDNGLEEQKHAKHQARDQSGAVVCLLAISPAAALAEGTSVGTGLPAEGEIVTSPSPSASTAAESETVTSPSPSASAAAESETVTFPSPSCERGGGERDRHFPQPVCQRGGGE